MNAPAVLKTPTNGKTFRASYPIDFSLRDDDGQAIITITDDPSEHDLHLEIANAASAAIEPIVLSAAGENASASADKHHFELRFRPGVLAAASLEQPAREADGWSISAPQQTDGSVSFYLLRTAFQQTGPKQPAQLQTIAPDEPIRLRLPQIGADGGGGARGTPVELRYRNLRYAGDTTPVEGSALFHLDIVNQRGKKYIPLHVGFAGSNTILNDGGKTPNELTLRITNASQSEMALYKKGDKTPSQFIISFDVAADVAADWAVATVSEAEKIEIAVLDTAHADWEVVPDSLAKSPTWTLTPQNNTSLAAGHSILIGITNIRSSLPSGQSNLYLRYENIPGYWDGQFVTTIEKAPILYDKNGNVGIGTAAPQHRLQIGGDVSVGIDPADKAPNAGYIRFGDNSGWQLHIARSREATNGALNIGTAGALMTIQDNGNVGIGSSPDSTARLSVDGGGIKAASLETSGGIKAASLETSGGIKATSLEASGDVKLNRDFFAASAWSKLHVVAGEVIRNASGSRTSQKGDGFLAHMLTDGSGSRITGIEMRLFSGGVQFAALLFFIAQRKDGTPLKTTKIDESTFSVDGLESFTFMAILMKQ